MLLYVAVQEEIVLELDVAQHHDVVMEEDDRDMTEDYQPDDVVMEEVDVQRNDNGESTEVNENSDNSRSDLFVCNACGSSTHRRKNSRLCPFYAKKSHMAARDLSKVPNERDDIGKMNIVCCYCNALMWMEEKISVSSKKNPRFQLCCCNGSAIIEPLRPTPQALVSLLDGTNPLSSEFKANIRSYNSSLSFASLGVKLDHSLANMRSGSYTFRIQGTPYHYIGSALPQDNVSPKFAQIYIHDSAHELDNRAAIFPDMNRTILKDLQDLMHSINPFVEIYKNMNEIAEEQKRQNLNSEQSDGNGINNLDEIRMIFRAEGLPDKRRYNLPTGESEVGVIIVGGEGSSDNDVTSNRDIVVQLKNDGTLSKINEKHQYYDALHYVLIHPEGSSSWNIQSRSLTEPFNKVSTMAYYSSRLMVRPTTGHLLHLYGKLFHQYIVDMYAKMEQGRLTYISNHQNELRSELYQGLQDALNSNDSYNSLAQLGRKIILPSSFVGGPRHMQQNYQDAMSIVRRLGKPDLFITVTCNPMWPEIQNELLHGQKASDRPELCARVFEIKLSRIIEEITKGSVFGRVVGYVYTIEFQKRGLPHAHMLFILHSGDKPMTVEDYDSMISAEIPDVNTHPLAYETVTKNMIHGPCGVTLNSKAPCMQEGQCSKGYPKQFIGVTEVNASGGYPQYRRRLDGKSIERRIAGTGLVNVDNRWVVPHNLYLCSKFNAHINVESCASIDAIKYLFKYVYKGHDRASVTLEQRDEIKLYLDARYVSAPEACWRLFHFHLHKEYPAHQRLQVHLGNEQTVCFGEGENISEVLQRAASQETTLTAWMKINISNPEARTTLYPDFPEHYVWHNSNPKRWTKRKNGNTIGRIYSVSPKQTEKYHLRMLLYHVPGATSFSYLRTVNGVVHPTYQQAAMALGLLESDNQWELCLSDAAVFQSAHSLRNLFCIIIAFCSPASPFELYSKFKKQLSDDYLHRFQNDSTLDPLMFDFEQRSYEYCILDLYDTLLGQFDIDLRHIPGFEIPDHDSRLHDDPLLDLPLLIRDQERLILLARSKPDDVDVSKFNEDQRRAYQAIIDASEDEYLLQSSNSRLFFVDGPGGTGKTYLFNALLHTVRRNGGIALAVASSGTASLLMEGGRTAHSTFKIPLRTSSSSMCNIKPNTVLAKLLERTKLIIWDEASMTSSDTFETVDRTFRDVMRHVKPEFGTVSFGGRLIVFGGDFRQILPVVPKGSRSDIVGQCLNKSLIWRYVTVLKLRINMRVQQAQSSDDPLLAQELQQFADYLLSVGDGKAETLELPSTLGSSTTDLIKLPQSMEVPGNNLINLLKELYPGLFASPQVVNNTSLVSSAVLTPKNKDVAKINSIMLDIFPGESKTYFSADRPLDPDQQLLAPAEYLNSIETGSLPPHTLTLKIGAPIMVLRNIDPKNGICNGTRLIVKSMLPNVIEAYIANGAHYGTVTYIPKIKIHTESDPSITTAFERCQFPVRLAFGMTINKAQGQTLDSLGIYLPSHVFGHGQLYVAMSRVKTPTSIKVMVDDSCNSKIPETVLAGGTYTRNVVYTEVTNN